MKSTRAILILAFATTLCPAARAQDGSPAASQQAGRDLYRALGGDRLTQQSLEAIVSIAGRDPKVAPYEGILRTWVDSGVASSHIGDDMAAYYSKTFTEKELKDILAFLKTPTGQKVVARMPDVIQHQANLSALMMEANRKELEDVLASRKGGKAGAKR